jgi:hypothetical protein
VDQSPLAGIPPAKLSPVNAGPAARAPVKGAATRTLADLRLAFLSGALGSGASGFQTLGSPLLWLDAPVKGGATKAFADRVWCRRSPTCVLVWSARKRRFRIPNPWQPSALARRARKVCGYKSPLRSCLVPQVSDLRSCLECASSACARKRSFRIPDPWEPSPLARRTRKGCGYQFPFGAALVAASLRPAFLSGAPGSGASGFQTLGSPLLWLGAPPRDAAIRARQRCLVVADLRPACPCVLQGRSAHP